MPALDQGQPRGPRNLVLGRGAGDRNGNRRCRHQRRDASRADRDPQKDDLSGSAEAEVIIGAESKDEIIGGGGDDVIYGGEGKDELSGGAGDDTLIGGAGKDQLTGGEGGDTFLFNPGEDGGAKDTISDFGIGDQVRLEGGLFSVDDVRITQDGDDAIIQIDGGDTEIVLNDVQADQLASYQISPEPGSDIIVVHQDDVPGG